LEYLGCSLVDGAGFGFLSFSLDHREGLADFALLV
jgi:hypothetical protein